MSHAFLSEWIKLKRRSLFYGAYGAIAAVAVLATAVTFGTVGNASSGRGAAGSGGASVTVAQLSASSGAIHGLQASLMLLGVIAFAIAATQIAMEFSQGTLRNLLIRQPRRLTFLGGKYLAVVSFMVGAVVLAAGAAVATAFVMAHIKGIPTSAWTTSSGFVDLGSGLLNVVAAVVGYATVGMVLGIVLRSSVAAVAIGIAYLLPVEQILAGTVRSASSYLPGQLFSALARGGTSDISYGHTIAGSLLYMAAAATGGALLFVRRDVTA